MNQSERHDIEVELNHKYDMMSRSLINDVKALRDPTRYFHYMLNGVLVPDHDMDGNDSPTELTTQAETMEFMFQQMTDYKEHDQLRLQLELTKKAKGTSAQDIINKIRKHKNKGWQPRLLAV